MSNLMFPILFAFALLPVGQAQTLDRVWPGWAGISNMFVFGDSYTTTGFQVNGTQPNPSNPLGNPEFPGRTTSNGRNWIDFLTYSHNDSTLSVYNFAQSGAIVDDYGNGNPNTVKTQVNRFFLPFYSQNNTSKATWTSENTLFVSFIGINDINTSYKLRNSTSNGETIAAYTRIAEQMYQAGARNFLFLNVPSIHRAPFTTSQNDASSDLVELNREAVVDLNSLISDMAQELLHDHEDATAFLFDTFTLYNDVLDDPTSRNETSGYTNTTSFCRFYARFPRAFDEELFDPACGVAQEEYFWLDALHPTPPIHNAMAADIALIMREDQFLNGNTTGNTIFLGSASIFSPSTKAALVPSLITCFALLWAM